LEYFSLENILPKEFDKLTNVCFQLHPHATWHTQLFFSLKEQSFAHLPEKLQKILRWMILKATVSVKLMKEHIKEKHFPKSAIKH
jgi:hypothetical protein